jgi:hypothetical protein
MTMLKNRKIASKGTNQPMSWRRMNRYFRHILTAVLLAASSLAMASEYHGQVTLGGLPVPGVSVTATQAGKTVVAVTDTQGLYSFPDLPDGTWSLQIEMTGFAKIKQDVAVAPSAAAGKWELKLMSLEQIRAETKPVKPETVPIVSANVVTPPTPKPDAPKPAAGKPDASKTAEAAPPPPPPDENSQRANDGFLINGSVNNAATSPFSTNPSFGTGRPGSKSLYNGGLSLTLDNSALDASPYSVTGVVTQKAAYNRLTAGINFGGPIRIFHFQPRGPSFFIGYQRQQNRTDSITPALVPDAAERTGNLSEIPIQLFNPYTGQAYSGNIVPISPQALALLAFYPLPNVTGSSSGNNYQTATDSDTHVDAMSLRLQNFSIGPRNQFNGSVGLQSSRTSSTPNIFNFLDTTDTFGINTNITYSHRFRTRLFLNAGYNFSRSKNRVTPNFANRTNLSNQAGITGNLQDAADWGPPSLSFSNGIAGISDAQSSFNRNETNKVSYSMSWNRTRHTISFGADFSRREFNILSQTNPRGSFGFTSTGVTTSGNALADFLIGVPDTSGIAYGNADKYLRQSLYDAFIDDDWRARPDLTIHAGFRWEYGAPETELKGRLVNLDVAPGFTSVAPVQANSPVGSLTGQHYPTSLLRPDKRGFEPRVGISWRPISGSSVLVKAGYGINDDTSVYQATAANMDQQFPLSTSLNVSNIFVNGLPCNTLQSGFNACSPTASPNTFAVDPNFRVGYVQTWQLSVQRDLPFSLQMTATYLGNKGTRGVQQFLPNTYPLGGTNPCPSCTAGFTYRTSNGNSTRESGNIQLRRRLRSGFTATLTYTYSKSIDDDAVVGGAGGIGAGATVQNGSNGVIAQNWLNLRGERGLSSFDQRNLLNANLQYTTGMGLGGRSLMSGWKGAAYKEWTLSTTIVTGSGTPETPTYAATLPGATCSNCLRPIVNGASIYSAPAGKHLNAAAYNSLATGQFGNARVDSITGPNQFSLNGTMARTFRLHDRFNLDARVDATNLLNHVVYSGWYTTLNPPPCVPVSGQTACTATSQPLGPTLNPLFGTPTNANGMRTLQITMRLRF